MKPPRADQSAWNLDNHRGHVVLSAPVVCGSNQVSAGDVCVVVMIENGLDVLVLDLSPQPVRAEENLVTWLQLDLEYVDVHVPLGRHGA